MEIIDNSIPKNIFENNTIRKRFIKLLIGNRHIDRDEAIEILKRLKNRSDKLKDIDVKKLKGYNKAFRVRLSDSNGNEWRIIYKVQKNGSRIIIDCSMREKAY